MAKYRRRKRYAAPKHGYTGFRGTKASGLMWLLGGLAIGAGAVVIYNVITPTTVPPGSMITSTGTVITPAQQAAALTPVSLV